MSAWCLGYRDHERHPIAMDADECDEYGYCEEAEAMLEADEEKAWACSPYTDGFTAYQMRQDMLEKN